MSDPMLEKRLREVIQARAEALLPNMLYDAALPLTEEIARLEREVKNLTGEVEWLEQHVKELRRRPVQAQRIMVYEERELTHEWSNRRDRENGRSRRNNCADCAEPCRGIRCLSCHKASGRFGKRRVA